MITALTCTDSEPDSDVKVESQKVQARFQISSPDFTEIRPKKRIPEVNTCHGENLSPSLSWSGAPAETKNFALLVEDVDHRHVNWAHWVIYNIPAEVNQLVAGIPSTTRVLPHGITQGTNDYNLPGYHGPCQPPVTKRGKLLRGARAEPAHKYVFTLYALDIVLDLYPDATKFNLLDAMDGHVIAKVETVGKSQGVGVIE